MILQSREEYQAWVLKMMKYRLFVLMNDGQLATFTKITPSEDQELQADPDKYVARIEELMTAKDILFDVEQIVDLQMEQDTAPSITIVPRKPITATAPRVGSKMDVCKQLYADNPGMSRGDMINLFIAQAGCTKAGASTYYQTCKSATK